MIARFNVLLEDIDRQIRGLSDAHLLTNERVLQLEGRFGRSEARVDNVEMLAHAMRTRIEYIETHLQLTDAGSQRKPTRQRQRLDGRSRETDLDPGRAHREPHEPDLCAGRGQREACLDSGRGLCVSAGARADVYGAGVPLDLAEGARRLSARDERAVRGK